MNKAEIINAGLKGIVSEIPVFGGFVTAYSEYDSAIKLKNIDNFLEDLKFELKKLTVILDKEYIKSDEAISLTRKTIDLAQKENKEGKRKMYAKFLSNIFTQNFSNKQEKEAILNTIELLSPLQLNCLVWIKNQLTSDNIELGFNYNPDAEVKKEFNYVKEYLLVVYLVQKSPGLENREAEALLSSMSSIGVIETHSTRGWTTVGGKMGIIGYRPTKLGLIVLEYLSDL